MFIQIMYLIIKLLVRITVIKYSLQSYDFFLIYKINDENIFFRGFYLLFERLKKTRGRGIINRGEGLLWMVAPLK